MLSIFFFAFCLPECLGSDCLLVILSVSSMYYRFYSDRVEVECDKSEGESARNKNKREKFELKPTRKWKWSALIRVIINFRMQASSTLLPAFLDILPLLSTYFLLILPLPLNRLHLLRERGQDLDM